MKLIKDFLIDYEVFRFQYISKCMPQLNSFFFARTELNKYYAEEIFSFIKKIEPDFKFTKIPFWESFETTSLSYDQEFKELLCAQFNNNDKLIIGMDDNLFQLKYSEYDDFVEYAYPNHYQMDFYQPTDSFFINCRMKRFILIQHSGFYGVYEQ